MTDPVDTTSQELSSVVQQLLQQNGQFNEIRANVQRKILNILRRDDSTSMASKRSIQNDNIQLLNQLILEYLQWFGWNYTAEMLTVETGSTSQLSDRRHNLETVLRSNDKFASDLPLLVNLLFSTITDSKTYGGYHSRTIDTDDTNERGC